MEQRTPEWFAARRGRITASSVGAILGLSPHMKRDDVMRNMVREWYEAEREFKGNVATEWGTHNEHGALIDYKMKTGNDVQEVGFISFEDWAGCSPDGLVGDDWGLEIKCPYGIRSDYCPVPFKTLAEQPHYYAQVQFSMFVTGRKSWDFFQWTINETRLESARWDQEWMDENIPRLRQFHAEFLDEVKNNADEHLQPKRAVIDTPGAKDLISNWDAVNDDLARLAELKKGLLGKLTDLAGGKPALIAGRKLTQVSRAGSVAYAKVVKDHCKEVDLEPYRGKPTAYWQLK